jgi:TusE/DsrC/DsvC family sulfur relay protein
MTVKRKPPKRAKSKTRRIAKKKVATKPKKKETPSEKRVITARTNTDPVPGPQSPRRHAPHTMYGILHPGAGLQSEPDFRDAPEGWTRAYARKLAAEAGVNLTEDHWEVIRVLQGCYKDEVSPRIRLLHDALNARFAGKGGMKYLFGILPGGPIAQGCALAGLKPPAGAKSSSFGSVA